MFMPVGVLHVCAPTANAGQRPHIPAASHAVDDFVSSFGWQGLAVVPGDVKPRLFFFASNFIVTSPTLKDTP